MWVTLLWVTIVACVIYPLMFAALWAAGLVKAYMQPDEPFRHRGRDEYLDF